MAIKYRVMLCIAFTILSALISIGAGSSFIPPQDVGSIILSRVAGMAIPEHISQNQASIVLNMRIPRAFLAFLTGAALGVSGCVMQSVLRNPLASSYTLGVSSGASLGAFLVMVTGFSIPFIGIFTLPVVGLVFGLATVIAAVAFSQRIDGGMQSYTIVLVGMVFSLFVNAVLSMVSVLSKGTLEKLFLWQMGSFDLKEMRHAVALLPIVVVGVVVCSAFHRELDIMTFGDEQALSSGVPVSRVKWILLVVSAALTGSAISMCGIVGFIDLIAPHVTRKLFSSSHRLAVPMSGLLAGAFLMLCDLLARTAASPSGLPVGVVTALIGAPFFAWLYLRKGRGHA